jgi:ADP-ribosylglycohydrolase
MALDGITVMARDRSILPRFRDGLHERIYACHAAATIANSMGDITEHLTWEQIEQRYGRLDEMLPQTKRGGRRQNDWGPDSVWHPHDRPPGMTEDGHERHRLICEAIIDKGERITVEDLARTWLRLVDPSKFGYLLGPQDQVIYYALKGGVHPARVGEHAVYSGFIGTAKMILPIGLINPGNPAQAAQDAMNVARLKDAVGRMGNHGVTVAAAVAAGAAAALAADATTEAVVEAVLVPLLTTARRKVPDAVNEARKIGDWKALRPVYQNRFQSGHMSDALEVLCGAMALFVLADGDPEQALLTAVNFGRDCDCRAYIAGGLAGAMRGVATLRPAWIETVERQLADDPHTVSQRSLADTAEGLYHAASHSLGMAQRQLDAMAGLWSGLSLHSDQEV